MITDRFKVIPTFYEKCYFRSRTEARWAVFFQTLGIKWEYEKEGYDLGKLGWYLPDFYLPSFSVRGESKEGVFIEIKGTEPTLLEQEKCARLAEGTKCPVFIFNGLPDNEDGDCEGLQFMPIPADDDFPEHVWWDNDMHFYQCKKCHNIKIEFRESNYMECSCTKGKWTYSSSTPQLMNAYAAARSARFEYGQSGAK